ncbi:MAG TPA: phospholipase D-like domain-containing protein [Longimicrobium sp.]|uniref:phospholipase D-like domain-containing protein n=1 Tax=Longimicrobium sp. TaxID=2029185 RepID=UPI002EDA1506
MLSPADVERLAAELPDYRPLPAYRAALPFHDCTVEIRLLARQSLSAVEQVVLRCVGESVDTVEAMGLVLGIGPELLSDAVENLLAADLVDPLPGEGEGGTRFRLTDRGTTALVEECFYRPEVIPFRLLVDAVTGELQPTNRTIYVGEDVARADGLHILPVHVGSPGPADLAPEALERVLAETRRYEPRRAPEGRLYDVTAVVSATRTYLPCDVVAFDAPDQSHVEFRVFERGARRERHERVLAEMFPRYQERILPLTRHFEVSPPAIPLEPLYRHADAAQAAVEGLTAAAGQVDEQLRSAEREAAAAPDVSETRQQVASLTAELARIRAELEKAERERDSVRRIDMGEHRRLLLEGLRTASKRVIIISPWIRPQAFNGEFRQAVARAVRRGAHVVIGWGYPEDLNAYKREQTESLIRRMRDEAKGGRGRLDIVEHGNTHEKVLIVDHEFMIVTSFNWLSFRGEWGQREEAGIYHRIRAEIDRAAAVYLDRLGIQVEAPGGGRRGKREPAAAPGRVSDTQRQQLESRGMRVRDRKGREKGRKRG